MTNSDLPELVNGAEAARIIGVDRMRVTRWVRDGELTPLVHMPKALLFDIRDVRAFAERRSQRAGAPA